MDDDKFHNRILCDFAFSMFLFHFFLENWQISWDWVQITDSLTEI
jgi:hypothetical protein